LLICSFNIFYSFYNKDNCNFLYIFYVQYCKDIIRFIYPYSVYSLTTFFPFGSQA